MKPERNSFDRQRGVMLLEALIAILIFSIGILAIIAMQTLSIQNVSQAKYRTDASFLANDLIGRMWASDRSQLQANFAYPGSGTPPASVRPWVDKVVASLPGVDSAATMPKVVIAKTAHPTYDAYEVKITIAYQTPQDRAASPPVVHYYDSVAYLPFCNPANC